jgi:hypothetical protein
LSFAGHVGALFSEEVTLPLLRGRLCCSCAHAAGLVPSSSTPDPSRDATRDDLRRLVWILALVWLALIAFTVLAQRYLGWPLAVGLIGGAGLLFTLGLLFVAGGSLLAGSLERRWAARRDCAGRGKVVCERCNAADAVVHLEQVENGTVIERHLCARCATLPLADSPGWIRRT